MIRLAGAKKSDSILALFFVSGFTGLIYESVWSHYVKLFLGHAAYAQTLVLVVFIGGLALGAWLCGRVAERLRNPLRLYAIVEVAVGLIAFAFHAVFNAAVSWGYDSLLPATCDPGSAVCASQWVLAALLLAPQSILLGATFPLVSSAALRRDASEPGHDIAALYFLNTFGAVLGVLASAFLLIPAVGLPGTLLTAGFGNLAVAAIGYYLSKEVPPPLPVQSMGAAQLEEPLSDRSLARLLLATAFLTGLSSFIYEIAWIRMLSLVLGASTHSFELMLASFLLGLALGGLWIRKRIDAAESPLKLLGRVQIIMGLAALATLPVYNGAFDLMAWVINAVANNEAGFLIFNLSSTLIALLVMLPATFCAGMTLPIITYRLLRTPRGEKALGTVYAVNTVGAILGVILAVHLLLVWFGLRGALIVGAAIDVGLGIVLLGAVRGGPRWRLAPEAVAGLALIAFMVAFFEMDMRRVSSGVFRGGAARLAPQQNLVFHRDGKTATVDVIENATGRSIRTNGKSDAAINHGQNAPAADEYTMALLAVLPLGHRPDAREAAIIGFGSGMSTAVLLASPTLTRVDTIEIEPAMIEGAKLFRPVVEAAFSDPRSHLVIDDAKSYFARGGRKYDIIISEPSNPWVSGVASLFTEEFYARLAHYLNDGGVLSQWLHTYEMDAATLASIIRAVSKTFPEFVVYTSVDADIVLVARKGGAPGRFDEKVLDFPKLQPVLERLSMRDPELIHRRAVATSGVIRPFIETYPVPANSDFFPVVDQRASRTRFTRASVRELTELQASPVPMLEMLGAAGVPSRRRHEAARVTYIDASTHDAWALHSAILGHESKPGDAMDQRLATAHLLREWGGCRTGIAFQQLVPALVELAETINPRLHPEVAAQTWRGIGASACGKRIDAEEGRWLALLDAIARRDAQGMTDQAMPLLASGKLKQGPMAETALLAGATGLICLGEPKHARALLEEGLQKWLRPRTHQSAVRLLDALSNAPPRRCAPS